MKQFLSSPRNRGLAIGGIVFIVLNTLFRQWIGGFTGDVVAGVIAGGLFALIIGISEWRNKKMIDQTNACESDDRSK
ncbi:MAG: hypothetical protein FWD84_04825 [Oscillospiraceae bacterium]|nr:hypothetical protein [Oscillospiraceae bacterium]